MFELAKRHAESKKWASVENQGGGALHIEVLRAENLPAHDSGGTSDPFVRLSFSNIPEISQEAQTEAINGTVNPEWKTKNKFEFYTAQALDELSVEVFDKDKFGKNDMLCKCKIMVGNKGGTDYKGKCLGERGEATVFLHDPRAGLALEAIDGLKEPARYRGQLTIRWKYSFSKVGTLFAAIDADPYEVEEYSLGKMSEEVGRFSNHIYYMCVPIWYWMDTCMWVRPFETTFWLAFIYTSTFVFPNLLSAFLPGILCASLMRTYWLRQRYGIDGPEEEVVSKGFFDKLRDTKATLHMTQIWCKWLSDILDMWYEIYQWKKQDTAMALTKGCLVWTLLILFFPWFPAFRYWLFAFMMYMYTLYPLYCYFPNLYRQYHEAALVGIIIETLSSIFNLRNCEIYIWPHLPRALVELIPPSRERLLQDSVTKELPTIPQDAMHYDDWRRFHDQYEERRRLLEVKKKAFESLRPRANTTTFRSSIEDLSKVKGRLRVIVLSASNIIGRDKSGLGDPFVIISTVTGQTEKTKEQKQTNRPVWKDATFMFRDINWKSGYLSVQVKDKNTGKDDLSLGTGRFPLSTLASQCEEEIKVPLGLREHGIQRGEVTLKLCPVGTPTGERAWPTVEQRELLRTEKARRDGAKPGALSLPPDTRAGYLSVNLLDGQALKVCDRNSSDPYVKVRLCDRPGASEPWNGSFYQEQKTKWVKSSVNPVWNQDFTFANAMQDKFVQIRVMDHDTGGHDQMGDGECSLNELFENDSQLVSIPLRLKGRPEGFVQMVLTAKGFGRPDPSPPLPVVQPPPTVASPSPSPARPFSQNTPGSLQSPDGARAGSQTAGGHSGRLRVTVIGARGLVPLPQNPKPEPFVKFRLHSPGEAGGQKFKTRACAAGTTEPVWNVTYTFQGLPADALRTSSLQIEVWDAAFAGESLAAGITPLNAVAEHGDSLESWVTVYRHNVHGSAEPAPAGEVRLVLAPESLDY
eukprot:Hpha_TRINITY_DN15032_c7_g11::TRINITY_DN15032_c7_g11_i1::g.124305::m.124305